MTSGAAAAPQAGILAGKAAAAAESATDGFAAYVLAAASVTPEAVLPNGIKTDIKIPEIKIKSVATAEIKPSDTKKTDDGDEKAASEALTALALLPLPVPPPPAAAAPLTEEAKTALTAAAAAQGADAAPATADAKAPSAPDTAAPAAPEDPLLKTGSTDQPAAQTPLQAGEAAGEPTPPPVAVDAETAAKTLTDVTVPDLLPPQPVLTDPVAVLGDARKTAEVKAASGQALGTQSTVLAAARDLLDPPKASSSEPAPSLRALERADEHSAVRAPALVVPPKPDTEAPKPQKAAAAEPPRASVGSPSPNAAAPAQANAAPPAHGTAEAGNAAPSASPAPQSDAGGTDASAPVAANATASATPPTAVHAEARLLPMTVIRADVQAGQTSLPVEQIAVSVARQFRQGTNRFEIRLDPPELGRIDVRLDLGHGGRATATLTVDRPETFHLLTRDSRALEQMLSDAGLRTDSGSLNFALRDQSGRNAPQDQGGQNSGPRLPAETAETPETTAPLILTATIEPGRLDLRV